MVYHHFYDHFSGFSFYGNGGHEDHAINAIQTAAIERGSDCDEIRLATHEQIPFVLAKSMAAQHDETGQLNELKSVVGHLTATGNYLPTNIARFELHVPSLGWLFKSAFTLPVPVLLSNARLVQCKMSPKWVSDSNAG